MTTRCAIRHAGADDAAVIAACLAAAFEPYRDSYTSDAFADTVLSPAGIEKRLREMTILIAEDEAGAALGTVAFTRHEGEGHLRGMAVLPRLHGEGVAGRLLAAAESELRARGCSTVTLDTTEPLARAVAFYTRHGFVPSGKIADFFGMRLVEYRKHLS